MLTNHRGQGYYMLVHHSPDMVGSQGVTDTFLVKVHILDVCSKHSSYTFEGCLGKHTTHHILSMRENIWNPFHIHYSFPGSFWVSQSFGRVLRVS